MCVCVEEGIILDPLLSAADHLLLSFFTPLPLAKSSNLREASPHALAERLRVRPRVREAVPLGVIDELGRHLHAETKVAQPSASWRSEASCFQRHMMPWAWGCPQLRPAAALGGKGGSGLTLAGTAGVLSTQGAA